MRKAILMISHNRHSFIVSEIIVAANIFDKVYIITPSDCEIENCCSTFKNVVFFKYNHKSGILSGLLNNFRLFMHEFLRSYAFFGKICNLPLLKLYGKRLLLYASMAQITNHVMQRILQEYAADEIVVLSMWFAHPAFATSLLKKEYPQIKSVSFAHSFEIDERKNPFVELFFKKICHTYLDKISFISKNVMLEYSNKYALPNGWRVSNFDVAYLGVFKKVQGISRRSNGNPYHIVSCSNVVPIKRVSLIYEALLHVKGLKIKWTHIGDGVNLPDLKRSILEKKDEFIECEFLGRVANQKVHEFYRNEAIDAVINVSLSEGLPVSLMEAAAYGIPLIATDVGGNTEIVNEKTGVVLPENPTVEEIAKAIKHIVTYENDYYRINAFNIFKANFDATVIRTEYYNSLKNND